MTPELQKYYENRFSMMATDGWRDLIEDIDNMANALNNISVVQDEKDLQFKDRKSTRLNSSHSQQSRMPSSA